MGSKWPVVRLGNHCLKIGSGATPKGGSSVYNDSGFIWLIRSQNIYNDGFNPSGLVFISEDAADKLKNVIVQENDILLNITGDSVARVCLAKKEYLPARVNQHVAIIRPDPKHFDARYLRYVLASPTVQQILLNLASAGATRNALTKSMIEEFEVSKPPLSIQVAVADHLESFDEKIHLNRQINQTLEQMAQTLFKSWFVDFDPVIDNALDAGNEIPEPLQARAELRQKVRASQDFQSLPADVRALFPAEFEESELGSVPKGWQIKTLGEMTSLIIDHRGKTPQKMGGEWAESGYPAISAKNIKDRTLVRSDMIRYVDEALYRKWMKEPLSPDDILMTSEAPLGEMFYLAEKHDYLLSQRLYGLRADISKTSGSYLYFWLQTDMAKSDMDGRATGTTVVGIRQSELRKINVLCPENSAVHAFSKSVSRYLIKIEHNCSQSETLERIRDELLPKLISGELRLDDLPDEVVTAANE
ncbi:restriction endonuclease subunit S [uncultured Tolumonas sp.]|uniref:restriction endonuclease subunit S n=1 Tax=uncultured Tolumonas sp. TaxID=263765 RepID=UPI002A0A8605|nr:restriction endonuclease subunit S [uncultured Tolumonas sp.]